MRSSSAAAHSPEAAAHHPEHPPPGHRRDRGAGRRDETEAEDDVRVVEDHLGLAFRDPHQVDDDLERERRRDVRDEVAFAALDHAVDDGVVCVSASTQP